jgi:hypothetical protein
VLSRAGDGGVEVFRAPAALSAAACAALRAALDTNGTSATDSVDGLSEHVLYLGSDELEVENGFRFALSIRKEERRCIVQLW